MRERSTCLCNYLRLISQFYVRVDPFTRMAWFIVRLNLLPTVLSSDTFWHHWYLKVWRHITREGRLSKES